ncbi:MAG: hypothetical protein R3D98_11320 [Candidatus Krumholzibacteriia bacterium]
MLEDGTVILGNNQQADVRRAIVVPTSNVGSEAMGVHLAREGIGFDTGTPAGETPRPQRAMRARARSAGHQP